MGDELDTQARIERQKTIRMALLVIALLIVAAILFGLYRTITAPVRVAQDTTQTLTRTVEETATAVLTRRHIEVREGRRFSRLADRAHAVLVALPGTDASDMAERIFRLAHLRGSRGKVCRFEMDMKDYGGVGTIPVWAAADNADFEANRTLGGEAQRQIRLVWETPDVILGVSAEYADQYTRADDAPHWELLWRRRDSLEKPLTDAVAGERAMNVLSAIPEQCGVSAP